MVQWHKEPVRAACLTRCWENDEEWIDSTWSRRLKCSEAALMSCPGLIYSSVLLHRGLRAAWSVNATLVLHRKRGTNGVVLLHKINWSCEAAPSKPFWSINHQARFCQGGWASWQELLSGLYHEQASASDSFTAVCRIPPILSSWLHPCCFLISRGSSRSSLVEMVCGTKVNAVCTIY